VMQQQRRDARSEARAATRREAWVD